MFRAAGLISFVLCVAVHAADNPFAGQTVPGRFFDAITPEDLPKIDHPAWANDLDKARAEAFRGRYKKSLLTLLAAKDADPIEVALIKGTSLPALGRFDEALKVLADARVADDPRVQVRRATILTQLGRADEAISLLKEHLEKHPTSIAGHFAIGQAQEQIGDLDAARNSYGWFVVEPQGFISKWQASQEKAFESAEEVTLIGRAIDRWALLTGSYQDLPNLHNTLMDMFVRSYDVIDRGYWPARLAAAEYFASHDNSTQALQELKVAVAANPSYAPSLELLGKLLLEQWNFAGAEAQVAAMRELDPQSTPADLLDARNQLQQRRPKDAAKPLAQVLKRQPRNLEALGLLAATHALRLEETKATEILKQVEQIDPDNATAYFEVAEQLGAMRQYPRSIAMYKIAIERAPWWTAARNGLGLLYTQSGDEELAKSTLDAAHAVDPFNMKTTNYLRLLDDLFAMDRKETEHFIVMYDANTDPIIPEYFADYLESIHDEVCGRYQHEPPVKTYIEVFPKHDAFSVRTTGSPWIGTVGASTGRVIAMVAPRKGEMTMGPFNWAQVLRHEYTHTVTLAATDNRIPHWMTEGLAVYEEQSPLKWEWIPMLYDAVTKGELFTMENLTWGFVRPKRPNDRAQAYAQSFWVCQYITETWGHDAVLKMLAEFKAGQSEQAVFQKILGKSQSEFEEGFFKWAEQQVASWGYDEETTRKYDELRQKGEELVKARQFKEAADVWEQIVKIRPVDPLPHQRLAGLYLTKEANNLEKAVEHLKALDAVELHDNRYAKRISRLYRDAGKLDEAKRYAMQSVYINPYDLDAHRLMLEVATKAGDQAVIDRESAVIPVLEQWIENNRKASLSN